MGPRAVITLRVLEEAHDAEEALESLLAGDEVAVDAGEQRQDPEARGTSGNDAVVAGHVFVRHARIRFGALPVIMKGAFLEHRQELVAAQLARGCGDSSRRRRFAVLPIRRGHAVARGDARFAEEIRKAVDAR